MVLTELHQPQAKIESKLSAVETQTIWTVIAQGVNNELAQEITDFFDFLNDSSIEKKAQRAMELERRALYPHKFQGENQ